MTITATALTSGTQGGAGSTSAQSATITPTAGRLYVLAAYTRGKLVEAGTTTATGCGLTWTEEGHQLGADAHGLARLTLFTGSGTPSSGKVTVSWANKGYASWSIVEFTEATAIRQLTTATSHSTTSNPHIETVTLGAFASAANGTYGAFASSLNIADMAPGTGFTELHEITNAINFTLQTIWRTDNDTTVDTSQNYGGTVDFIDLGMELVTDVAAQEVAPTGIVSNEALGAPAVSMYLVPTAISSAEAFGTLSALEVITPTGIASAEAFGTIEATGGDVTISPEGIASAEAFGTLSALPAPIEALPDGIASLVLLGSPSVSRVLIGASVASTERGRVRISNIEQGVA